MTGPGGGGRGAEEDWGQRGSGRGRRGWARGGRGRSGPAYFQREVEGLKREIESLNSDLASQTQEIANLKWDLNEDRNGKERAERRENYWEDEFKRIRQSKESAEENHKHCVSLNSYLTSQKITKDENLSLKQKLNEAEEKREELEEKLRSKVNLEDDLIMKAEQVKELEENLCSEQVAKNKMNQELIEETEGADRNYRLYFLKIESLEKELLSKAKTEDELSRKVKELEKHVIDVEIANNRVDEEFTKSIDQVKELEKKLMLSFL